LVFVLLYWYILLPFGIFHCNLVYFIAIWYISLQFGIFHCNLVFWGHVVIFNNIGF
jgi:hypothetical protein